MRRVLTAAAAVAACGLITSGSAFAQTQYQAGGPSRVGNMCRVGTDEGGSAAYGYYQPCPQNQPAQKAAKAAKAAKPSPIETGQADTQYQAGGPSRIGNMCRVGTDEGGSAAYGYYRPCPPDQQAKAVKPRKKKSS